MTFRDFHTHNLLAPAGEALINLPLGVMDGEPFEPRADAWYSAGIHPWRAAGTEAQECRLLQWLRHPRVVAVGECGLDRLCDADYAAQRRAFAFQLEQARRLGLPVVVHCVRAMDDVLAHLRQCPGLGQVVVHGFRGKPEQARQWLAHGVQLSFGPRFNAASLRLCPPALRHAETDEAPVGIEAVEALHRRALAPDDDGGFART